MSKKNVISPHLQIYNIFSKSMTSSVSITDRMAFVFLLPFLLVLASIFIVASISPVGYKFLIDILSTKAFLALLFIASFAFYYHFYATFRYILIEFGCFTSSKKSVAYSAWFVILVSFVSTIVTWYFVL